MSAADDAIVAMYGELDEARKRQILDYRHELAEEQREEQRAEELP